MATIWDQFSDPVDAAQADQSWDSFSDPVAPPARQAKSRAQLMAENPGEYDPASPEYQAKYGATSGMSGGQKFAAGMGKAFVDLGRGAGQLVGLVDRQDVAESRLRDAPLMQSGAAKFGNFAGNVAATIPAIAIPGANTVAGAGAIGAGLGLLQPSTSTRETLLNVGVGGAAGAGGQYLGKKVGAALANRAATKTAAAESAKEANSVRDAVLQEARQAGYVVPPTAVKDGALNTALESVAGKAAVRQVASGKNAKVTNALVAKDLGLPENKPITKEALQAVRAKAGKAYEAVRSLGAIESDEEFVSALRGVAQVGDDLESAYPGIGAQASAEVKALVDAVAKQSHDSRNLVGLSKFLRNRSSANFKAAFGAGGDPQKLEIARAQSQVVDAIEDLIDRHLQKTGQQEIGQAWSAARTTIAKAHQAEAALDGGNVSAEFLARQMRKGKPVSGGMGIAARFADQFREVAKKPQSGQGVSKLAATFATGGAGAALATGNVPLAATLSAVATAPYPIRYGLLSRAGQSALASPSYGTNLLGNQAAQFLARYGAIPGAGLAVQGGQ